MFEPEEKVMVKRLISVCFVVTFIFGVCGCVQTAKDSLVAEPEIVDSKNISEEASKSEYSDSNIAEETKTMTEDLSERITDEADTIQYDSVDMVYDNTLFTDANGDELCKLSKFEDMDYYIFCDTALAYGPSDIIHSYGIFLGKDLYAISYSPNAKFAEVYRDRGCYRLGKGC